MRSQCLRDATRLLTPKHPYMQTPPLLQRIPRFIDNICRLSDRFCRRIPVLLLDRVTHEREDRGFERVFGGGREDDVFELVAAR